MTVKIALRDGLRRKREALLDHWFRRMLADYEGETASFLKNIRDRFANPAAYAFREAMEAIYQAVVDGREVERGSLEYAIKIKALQERDSSRGVSFIYLLKDTARDMLADSVAESEWTYFNSHVDRVASIAAQMFAANREKIAEIAIGAHGFENPARPGR
jgi:hypothetical protein